ncbi:MAG: hypothetical protein WBA77_00405 [Microcoleaceae cyanobacterium]
MKDTNTYIDRPDFLKYYQISLSGLMSNLNIQEIYQIASNSPSRPDLKELIVKAALNLTHEAIKQLESFEEEATPESK